MGVQGNFKLMASVFLGAGFSTLGGVSLASQLFYKLPTADVTLSVDLIERVLNGWDSKIERAERPKNIWRTCRRTRALSGVKRYGRVTSRNGKSYAANHPNGRSWLTTALSPRIILLCPVEAHPSLTSGTGR